MKTHDAGGQLDAGGQIVLTMRVLAFTKYGSLAASTRQRFEQFEPALAAAGITVDYASLFDDDHMRRLVAGCRAPLHAVLRAYFGRLFQLRRARQYDALWVYSDLFPYWPGAFERIITWSGRPVIFDYDDAFFHTYDASSNPVVRALLAGKFAPLLRSASICCCGNEYLRAYAAQFCKRTMVLPTVVDTDRYLPAASSDHAGPLVIGWIGSPSTWANVRPLLPLLRDLAARHGAIVRAVGAGVRAQGDRFAGLELVEWAEEREIADVQGFDIGIMPLEDAPFQRGKCGYKLIQYMACAKPVVASPVGVNTDIVDPGTNGELASTLAEWEAALLQLLSDPAKRRRYGQAGREKIVEQYSLQSQAPRLVAAMRQVMEGDPS